MISHKNKLIRERRTARAAQTHGFFRQAITEGDLTVTVPANGHGPLNNH